MRNSSIKWNNSQDKILLVDMKIIVEFIKLIEQKFNFINK
jgi:hypothetical protein